jgi:predicted hydrocarbon binding protein
MNEISIPQSYYPNRLGRIILMAMEEIVGRIGLNAVLNHSGLSYLIQRMPPNNLDRAFRFEVLSQIMISMEELYGERGGRGLALRTGRACFKYSLREFGPLLGFTDLSFRLLPQDEKIKSAAKFLALIFNKYSDQRVKVEEDDTRLLWMIESCPVCWQRHSDVPVCHLPVGLIQETMYWVSGGKYYTVEERECVAQEAAACVILIDKKALD